MTSTNAVSRPFSLSIKSRRNHNQIWLVLIFQSHVAGSFSSLFNALQQFIRIQLRGRHKHFFVFQVDLDVFHFVCERRNQMNENRINYVRVIES